MKTVVILLWLLVAALYVPGLLRINRFYSILRFYRQHTDRLAAQNDSLRAEITRLKTDPFLTEKLAREELGLIREGEWVIKMSDARNNTNLR